MTKTCPHCQLTFSADQRRRECCSRSCAQQLRSKRWAEKRARTCLFCGLYSEDLSVFVLDPKSLFGRRNRCNVCQNNKIASNVKRTKAEIIHFVRELKSKPCYDCKKQYHYAVMDFDHVAGEKKFNVGRMLSSGFTKLDAVVDEINKCQLVCSNCHRMRTQKRFTERKLITWLAS